MKREDLFEAIGGVDDILLEENVAPARKHPVWQTIAGIAACAAVTVFAIRFLSNGMPERPEVIGEVHVEQTEYHNAPSPGRKMEQTECLTEMLTEEINETENEIFTSNGSDVENTSDEVELSENSLLRPGIWYARGIEKNDEMFYCFYDGKGGSFLRPQDGSGVEFFYESEPLSGTEFLTFHMGSVENIEIATLTVNEDSENLILNWEGRGISEQLSYVESGTFDTFRFCCNEDLYQKAADLHNSSLGEEKERELEVYAEYGADYSEIVIVVMDEEEVDHYIANRITGEVIHKDDTPSEASEEAY